MNDENFAKNVNEVESRAHSMRRLVVKAISSAKSGHPGGSLGQADIFATLYFGKIKEKNIMNFSRKPLNLLSENRDILIQSNGHTAPIRYAAFCELGLFDENEMLTLRKMNSRLQGHPERIFLPEVETTSGPLGEGLSQAAGMAYAFKNFAKTLSPENPESQSSRKVFVTLGDGELNEGQNWEAMMFAAKNKLSNLIAIIDFNDVQLSGKLREIMPMDPIAGKFASFGWEVFICNGNSVHELLKTFEKIDDMNKNHKPKVLIAKTKMGAGIKSIEGDYHWHGKAPDAEILKKWTTELDENFTKNKGDYN